MKDFIREGQKLPLWGIGPRLIWGMAAVGLVEIVLFCSVLRIGAVDTPWRTVFGIGGGVLVALGIAIWLLGAIFSDMYENIATNRLKTDGIYAWVRNPIYSGWWFLISSISLLWHNVWLLSVPFINWLIMRVVLKNSEEKWLLDLYGDAYAEYMKNVNRCIPWKRRSKNV